MTTPRIAVAPNKRIDDYVKSVQQSGGEPVVLDTSTARAADVVRDVDGLLLTGGGDVDPRLYGEERHPSVYGLVPDRDALELELVVRGLEHEVPMLCICRGMQVLNVALGGTLVQDILSAVPQALNHTDPDPPHKISHDVLLAPGARLTQLLRPDAGERPTYAVNSRHHQALKHVASSLVVTATAPDGVIEAVERPESAFCLAVQWHPENFWRTGEFRALFDALIEAASTRRRG